MSDIRRKKRPERKKLQLQRGIDGRLRSASEEADIGDLWAQQKRIRLAEAIEEDKKKESRKKIRKERGLVGVAKEDLTGLTSKVKTELFGQQATTKKPPQVLLRPPKAKPEVAKKVEININVAAPKLPKLKLASRMAVVKKKVAGISKKTAIITGAIVLVIVVGIVGFHMLAAHNANVALQKANAKAAQAAQAAAGPTAGTPNYQTILPAGRSVQSLGGWYRVSPPGKSPVYAFADSISGVVVDVSEQPLPPNFREDTSGQVSSLAQSFNAKQTLSVNGTTAYIGTSAQGPQSVILAKSNLLILLKSKSLIPNNQWIAYINSLQ